MAPVPGACVVEERRRRQAVLDDIALLFRLRGQSQELPRLILGRRGWRRRFRLDANDLDGNGRGLRLGGAVS
jgi:hypothetical protein